VRSRAKALGYPVSSARVAKVYLIEGAVDDERRERIARALLADPVTEQATFGAESSGRAQVVEVLPLPGVMDPAAQSVRSAIRDLTGLETDVLSGVRFDLEGVNAAQASELARRVLANPVVHQIRTEPFVPKELPRGQAYRFALRSAPLRGLSDEQLLKFSREAHLFMSLPELRAVAGYYEREGRDPTDIELETIAQTWSEHCVHKTLKSTVLYREGKASALSWAGRPGHEVNADGSVTIRNLLKSTVAAATNTLIKDGVDWTLSVFKDNSGVVAFDETHGVCIKVETHNRPSALEPYGGAATGVGGCIRDVIGTGLGAKPIANTDVFCVAMPGRTDESLPPGTLHPKRILTEVVAGVRDYGNRMGIPTVAGGVHFDDRYVGNPLVFAGCVGLIPKDLVHGRVHAGDRIIALGGRTGRDGIHGATFSSAELEHTHADEFSHAVQIGNAIEEKRVLDAILRARDAAGGPLYNAMTDCGAGGFSSAVGEMGKDLGAEVNLERAPLKYDGLSYTEVWISEAQERMVLAVPPERVEALRAICEEEHVELADLGRFGTERAELVLRYHGTEVGRLSMHFLHEGLPMPTREAEWNPAPARGAGSAAKRVSVQDALLTLLAHPSVASKHWIIRQYDHEVQGNTVVKPLVGPGGRGPSDASVIEPSPGSGRGIALASGLQTGLGDTSVGGDPYWMTLAAIDECVRNLVCAGADPARTAILDNFCWPSCDEPRNMGALVRACEACYDGAVAYRTPFVSGKDSLNNQLRYEDPRTGEKRVIEIPCTLLISGLGLVPRIDRCVTMDAKRVGNVLLLVGRTCGAMGGSLYQQSVGAGAGELAGTEGMWREVPRTDLAVGPRSAAAVAAVIAKGLAASAHDCSEGGVLVAVAEMVIATTGGVAAPLGAVLTGGFGGLRAEQAAFAETPSRYVLEVAPGDVERVLGVIAGFEGVEATRVGEVTSGGRLVWKALGVDADVRELARVWREPLDW